jgi:hypothetical protein
MVVKDFILENILGEIKVNPSLPRADAENF